MDQATLVDMQIEDGKRLIDRLVEEGIGVTAAGWLRGAEDGQWFLYIATPLVDDEGATRKAYARVNAVIRQMPPPFWVDPMEVKLIGPNDPVAKALQSIHRHYPGNSSIRYGEGRLGGMTIEGAYVYPPVPAPAR
jgi:hypothetical protein